MFKKEALDLIRHPNMLSRPFSRLSMLASAAFRLSCIIFIFSTSQLHNAVSTLSNSFTISFFSSHAVTFLFISFDTSAHLLRLCFDPDKNNERDWKMELLVALTSLWTRITAESCWSSSWSGDIKRLLSICFRVTIIFLASFLIFFLKQVKLAMLFSTLESPFRLRMAEWRAWTCALICNKVSLVMPQISRSFTDPSNNSSIHFSCWFWERTRWLDAIFRRSSKYMYNSSSPERLLQIDPDVNNNLADSSNDLTLLNSSSILMVLGWDLEGKLIHLTWYLLAMMMRWFYQLNDSLFIGTHWRSININKSLYSNAMMSMCIKSEDSTECGSLVKMVTNIASIMCNFFINLVWHLQTNLTSARNSKHHLRD